MTTLVDAPRWTTTLGDVDARIVATAAGPIEAAVCGRPMGTAPVTLLIHGIPGSWRQCVPLAEDLADTFTVVLPSRPGYGRTPISVGRTYDEHADACAALFDALGVERAAVLGISGGGPAAVAFAARHHERTSALVMACAMAPHLVKVPLQMRAIRIPWLAEFLGPRIRERELRKLNDPDAVEAALRDGLTEHEYGLACTFARVREDLLRHSLSHFEAPAGLDGQRNDLAAILSARPQTYDVRCPALLLYGDSDVVIPLRHAEYYAEAIPGAELVTFEHAGHVFALTRRDETSAMIRSFFERSN